MSTFSKTGFKTLNYNSFRPRYPPSFYQLLSNYGGGRFGKTLDVGCGTGIATYDILNISDKVVGIDLSPSMVDTCNSLIDERCNDLGIDDSSRISFKVGDLDNLNVEGGFDLIIGAQCLHWSKDFDQLFANIYRLLNPGGVFAYWYYVDPIAVDFTPKVEHMAKSQVLHRAKEVYFNYMYDDANLVGPYWEQPGRNIIKSFYTAIDDKIPKVFSQVKTSKYQVDLDNYVPPSEAHDLVLTKPHITIDQSLGYISTYSGVHNYLEAHELSTIMTDYVTELKRQTGWQDTTKFDLVWNTGYTFMKK